MFGCCEEAVGAFSDDVGDSVAKQMVYFFEERMGRLGEGFEPGVEHAYSLYSLA